MKVILDNKSHEVRDLTIEQYLVLKENPNIKDHQLIHLMTGIPVDDIMEAPMGDVKFVAKMLMSQFIESEDLTELDLEMDIDGIIYGLIRPSKMSYEEWINMEVFMAESPVDVVKLATHLYRPVISEKRGEERELEKYDLDTCLSRGELFKKKMSMRKIITALFFLTTFAELLTTDFLSSIPNRQKREKLKEMNRVLQQKKLSSLL